MKSILTAIFLCIGLQSFSQTDQDGNPVFNSVSLREDTLKGFTLLSNYYTLKNNIDNKGSSVYISAKPTLDEIMRAATSLPSDFFVVMKGRNLVNVVLLTDLPTRRYLVINPATGKQTEFECLLKGKITENRAAEIIKERYDANAKLKGAAFYCNGTTLDVITNQTIRNDVLALIEKQQLSAGDSSDIKIRSKEEMKTIVLAESKEGGKLDFFSPIKGREMEAVQVKPGVFTTRIMIALYKWGQANFDLGVNTAEDALEFWAAFKGRQPNQREKDGVTLGFNKGLEKD